MPENGVHKRRKANTESRTALFWAAYNVYRVALNTPVFSAFLLTATGLKGLDIGNGNLENTISLAPQGAAMSDVGFGPAFILYARAA